MLMGAVAQAQIHAPSLPTKQAELLTWKTYSIKHEQISALFPTHPAMTSTQRHLKSLNKWCTDRMIGAYADGVVYGIYIFENPETKQALEGFIGDQSGYHKWEASTKRSVKVAGVDGTEYSTSLDEKMPETVQFISANERLYKFTATGAPPDDPGVKQFFASIALDKKKGIEVSDGPGLPFDEPRMDVLTGRQVDRKVRVVMKPEPAYTEPARQAMTVGTVVLKVVFSSSGSVINISTVEALPHGLTEQAVASARKIKFIPAIKDGRYVSMWMQLEYNFSLY